MSLNSQVSNFKKKLLNHEVIQKKKIEPTIDQELARKQPVFYTANEVPVSRQLFEVIDCLRNESDPITNNDIIRKRAINILETPKLLEAVKANDRIEYDEVKGTFKYKPIFNIKTKQDLLQLLKQNRGITAMDIKELKNSNPSVMDLINDLIETKSVVVARNRDNTPKMVYYNDNTYNSVISDEFKEYWHQQQIPADIDLAHELVKVGLKPVKVITKQSAVAGSNKKKKRKTRFKMTNTHLQGVGNEFLKLDLTKDYHGEPAK